MAGFVQTLTELTLGDIMTKYQPNFSHARVIATAKRALSFVALYTRPNSRVWISRNELYKHFGNTSRPLGKYLKQLLLVEADKYYNPITGTCKKYTQNKLGVNQLQQLLGLEQSYQLTPELEQQLETGEFEYDEKSNRLYNPLQFVTKQVRGSILANRGYRYHYDIEAAAPTLLIQRAKQLDPSLELPNLEYYTQNRSQVRDQISSATGINNQQVKTVINALLQGSKLSVWQGNQLYKELDYSYYAMNSLKENAVLGLIREDIRLMWKTLKQDFPQRYMINCNGKTISQRLSAKDKSGLYRELEDQVGKIIRKLLKKRKIQHLWIHDGWCCNGFINPDDVVDEVRRTTGYSLKLEWNKYEDM